MTQNETAADDLLDRVTVFHVVEILWGLSEMAHAKQTRLLDQRGPFGPDDEVRR